VDCYKQLLFKEVKNNYLQKYRFLLCNTYVFSLLTDYFFEGCQAEFTLDKAASSSHLSWRKKGSSCPNIFSPPASIRSACVLSYCSCWLLLRSDVLLNRKELNSQSQNAVVPFLQLTSEI